MRFNIKELLDFFDDKKNSQKGDASALMALLGEDLNSAVYKHFRNNKVEILDDSVLPGTSKGKRLDRWIVDTENAKMYQCEIKNWAATAIGGRSLKSDASDEEIKQVTEHYWKHQLNNDLSSTAKHPTSVSKVLLKMKKPESHGHILKIEPLLIYWMPISLDTQKLNPLSVVTVKSLKLPMSEFSKLTIFSVSVYLRQLYKRGKGKKYIDLDMPHFEHRIGILERIQTTKII